MKTQNKKNENLDLRTRKIENGDIFTVQTKDGKSSFQFEDGFFYKTYQKIVQFGENYSSTVCERSGEFLTGKEFNEMINDGNLSTVYPDDIVDSKSLWNRNVISLNGSMSSRKG